MKDANTPVQLRGRNSKTFTNTNRSKLERVRQRDHNSHKHGRQALPEKLVFDCLEHVRVGLRSIALSELNRTRHKLL